jgi:hypothetical protein
MNSCSITADEAMLNWSRTEIDRLHAEGAALRKLLSRAASHIPNEEVRRAIRSALAEPEQSAQVETERTDRE